MVANPLVSIITITYNSERFLEETVRSVVEQDYPNIEYIIMDGGSTDGTLSIVEKYQGTISKVVSEPDQGISDAMNKGIRMAAGDIIGIVHSDDRYADPHVISHVVETFGRYPEVQVVYGIQDFVDPHTGKVLLQWGRDEDPSEIRKHMYMPHPTVFCRKGVYEAVGLFRLDYKYAMDYEWAIRVARYTRPHFVNRRLASMRNMGTSAQSHWATLRETLRALWEHGYRLQYVAILVRGIVKVTLFKLGLKGLVFRIWSRKVKPEETEEPKVTETHS
jgi:glycosyltransferase involved in cell wall biosynthesis